MDKKLAEEILKDIEFYDSKFIVLEEDGRLMLQMTYYEPDVNNNDNEEPEDELQKTRKWILSKHMTKSELIQTAFKAALTSMEHRTREWFKFKGKSIFGPHYDVDVLLSVCEQQDVRKPIPTT